MENKQLKVINLFGAPGSGKSTAAAGLFFLMKKECNVELVTEFAKDLTWEKRQDLLLEQDFIFAEQHRRLRRLVGKVDYVITDSPLLNSVIYQPKTYPKTFTPFVEEVFNSYTNFNFLIERASKSYQGVGRNQTKEEADALFLKFSLYLKSSCVKLKKLKGDDQAPNKILVSLFC